MCPKWGKIVQENRLDNELNSDNNIGSILAYQTTVDADASFSLVAHVMVGGDKGPRCGPWGRLSDPRHGPLRSPWPHCPSLLKSCRSRNFRRLRSSCRCPSLFRSWHSHSSCRSRGTRLDAHEAIDVLPLLPSLQSPAVTAVCQPGKKDHI